MPYGASTSNTDILKLYIGDLSTAAAGELLSTKACNVLLARYGSAVTAAPAGARAIAARFAGKVDKMVGKDLRLAQQQKYEHWIDLANQLERAASLGVTPYAGGISNADKDSVNADTDRVQPNFRIGLDDSRFNNQGASPSTST